MAPQTLELAATTPLDEPCAQVGSENYIRNSRKEAQAFINQIMRKLRGNLTLDAFRDAIDSSGLSDNLKALAHTLQQNGSGHGYTVGTLCCRLV
jgi:hypothetical protein